MPWKKKIKSVSVCHTISTYIVHWLSWFRPQMSNVILIPNPRAFCEMSSRKRLLFLRETKNFFCSPEPSILLHPIKFICFWFLLSKCYRKSQPFSAYSNTSSDHLQMWIEEWCSGSCFSKADASSTVSVKDSNGMWSAATCFLRELPSTFGQEISLLQNLLWNKTEYK